jgi:hypothetical protein
MVQTDRFVIRFNLGGELGSPCQAGTPACECSSQDPLNFILSVRRTSDISQWHQREAGIGHHHNFILGYWRSCTNQRLGSRFRARRRRIRTGWEDFQDRHDLSFPSLIPDHHLNQYLDRTSFIDRVPSREEFAVYVCAVERISGNPGGSFWLGGQAENIHCGDSNEPLGQINTASSLRTSQGFPDFFSSCFVIPANPMKRSSAWRFPSRNIPPKCVFIDDRAINLENPRRLGRRHPSQDAPQLLGELKSLGIEV